MAKSAKPTRSNPNESNPTRSNPTATKRWAFIALTGLGGIVLGLVAAELTLRAMGYQFTIAPSVMQFGWPDPATIEERYGFDPDVFWVQKNYTDKLERGPGERPAIVFMGDSCTELGRYDQALVTRAAEQFGGEKPTFVNLGVGGWSSYQGLRQLERDVVPLDPQLVTIYYGWNDHWNTFGLEDKSIARFYRYRDPSAALRRLRVVQLLDSWAFQRMAKQEAPEARVQLDDFRANLTEMVRVARENDITPVLLTAPTSFAEGARPARLAQRHLKSFGEVLPLHLQYVDVVREVAASEDAALVDLYALFDALPKSDERTVYFMGDGIHLTPQGSTKLGELLFDELLREGLLDGVMANN